tara:strand:- start:301 stop:912 length:612 start_codon:yes stop_codon:yes gene_type:complete
MLAPGMTVVDVGSNIGIHARLLANLVGTSGRVYAFEPHPDNYHRLQTATAETPQVATVQAAISDNSGRLPLYVSESLNVDHRTYESGEKRPAIDVPCHRLDDYLPSDMSVDFIKIDVQGAEWSALRGMTEVLDRSRGVRLILEYWPWALREATGDPLKPIHFLQEKGFRLEIIGGGNRIEFSPEAIVEVGTNYCNLYAYRPAG